MNKIRLDPLHRRGWLQLPINRPLSLLTVLVGIALLGYLITLAESLSTERRKVAQLNQQLQSARHSLTGARPAPAVSAPPIAPAQIARANAAIAQLNLPWREILAGFEELSPRDGMILSLEPNSNKRLVRATLESANTKGMFAAIASLENSGYFSRVALIRQDTHEQDPNRPLRYTIEAWIDEAALSRMRSTG